jgi:hypothetical protein
MVSNTAEVIAIPESCTCCQNILPADIREETAGRRTSAMMSASLHSQGGRPLHISHITTPRLRAQAKRERRTPLHQRQGVSFGKFLPDTSPNFTVIV